MQNDTAIAVKENQNNLVRSEQMNGNKSIMRAAGSQQPLTMNELKFYGSMIHEAGLIPKTANETPRQLEARAMAKVIAGHCYGFDPILSMRLFDVINGKLQPTSECVSVLIKRSGRYNYRVVEWTHTACNLQFFQKSADGSWKPSGNSIFTIDDAKKAGLTEGPNKHNWTKYTRNMLLARAITNGKRLFCADVMDPTGYFGGSGNEVVESLEAPEDLEYFEPPQLEAAPDLDAATETEDEDESSERSEESQIEDLLLAIGDRVSVIGAEKYEQILNGRKTAGMDKKALTLLLQELKD